MTADLDAWVADSLDPESDEAGLTYHWRPLSWAQARLWRKVRASAGYQRHRAAIEALAFDLWSEPVGEVEDWRRYLNEGRGE